MGRKRKTLDDWCKEHDDLQIATKDSEGTRTLVCKYCNTEMVTDPAKKPYDRIREHLMSSRHKKFKTASKEAETAGTSQQTLFDMSCRQRAKETEADGVIHDFVRALAYSGISMYQADGPLGDFARKYCKAAKTMPTGQILRLKYLKEAFDKDMEKIRDDMRDVKVSVIVDESPDITGVPTINTLLCYYSQKNVKKHVVLVDVDRVNASNSYTVASAVSKALLTVDKTWKDVVAVATDSAEYMRKMVREICQAEGIQILHVKDIAHLIHHEALAPCESGLPSTLSNTTQRPSLRHLQTPTTTPLLRLNVARGSASPHHYTRALSGFSATYNPARLSEWLLRCPQRSDVSDALSVEWLT
ncbi:hypothetical protein HPB49_024433 [Dermacentor silvarum]|uniref:Uncharacterized protein n=1 Tax=Dermacentor silvarum TaxID=543639 RepID=A0ACB8CIE3_DERSI|nr:hypothetical protein HPB49_024433 [Dermacentor silvarum]